MPLVAHYWADLQSLHGLRCYGNITRTLVTSLRPSRDILRHSANAGRGLRALLAGDWRVTGAFSKLCGVCGKWVWLAGRWLAVDCGGLDCGLPLLAFWQHHANAKCYRVHACTLYSLYA